MRFLRKPRRSSAGAQDFGPVVRRFDVEPGDVIVVDIENEEFATAEAIANIHESLDTAFPGHLHLIVDHGLKLGLVAAPGEERGQKRNGMAKPVSSVYGDLLVAQAKRYDASDTDFEWGVALVAPNREDVFDASAARRLAGGLLAAASEAERFQREDVEEISA